MIPVQGIVPFASTERAPKHFVHLNDVAVNMRPGESQALFANHSGSVFAEESTERCESRQESACSSGADANRFVTVAGRSFLEEGTVESIYQGQFRSLVLPSRELNENRLFVIPDGHVVGRNGCLMDGDGRAIFEAAFLYKPGRSVDRPYKPFDPRHWKHLRRGNLTARRTLPKRQRLSGVSLSINNCSCHNFFHWLTEVAPRVLAARRAGIRFDHLIVDHQAPYQREILSMLGTTPDQWIQPHSHLNVQCDLLLWSNEPSFELLQHYAHEIRQAGSKAVHESDQSELLASHSENSSEIETRSKIYLTRKSARHRKLYREDHIERLLLRNGFRIVDFDRITFREQLKWVSSASHIVAIHGAALGNLIFASRGTKIVEIVPRDRYNYDLYPNQSRVFGLEHMLVEAKSSRFRQWLNCETRDLEEALERLG